MYRALPQAEDSAVDKPCRETLVTRLVKNPPAMQETWV